MKDKILYLLCIILGLTIAMGAFSAWMLIAEIPVRST